MHWMRMSTWLQTREIFLINRLSMLCYLTTRALAPAFRNVIFSPLAEYRRCVFENADAVEAPPTAYVHFKELGEDDPLKDPEPAAALGPKPLQARASIRRTMSAAPPIGLTLRTAYHAITSSPGTRVPPKPAVAATASGARLPAPSSSSKSIPPAEPLPSMTPSQVTISGFHLVVPRLDRSGWLSLRTHTSTLPRSSVLSSSTPRPWPYLSDDCHSSRSDSQPRRATKLVLVHVEAGDFWLNEPYNPDCRDSWHSPMFLGMHRDCTTPTIVQSSSEAGITHTHAVGRGTLDRFIRSIPGC
ncbi:hypothetical protein BKA70DRAFT_1311765 [Coprinopsis sp. MPI-PUGE-AT-0042]|nr:hypothetical protein BKA70DRAFT_1311765 [Coprinopsis sp. MPI-PUGE-AT-0042]